MAPEPNAADKCSGAAPYPPWHTERVVQPSTAPSLASRELRHCLSLLETPTRSRGPREGAAPQLLAGCCLWRGELRGSNTPVAAPRALRGPGLDAGPRARCRLEQGPLPRGHPGWALTPRRPSLSSGYAYTRPEAGNELDMELGEEEEEEDTEGSRDGHDAESGSIEEDRCVRRSRHPALRPAHPQGGDSRVLAHRLQVICM